MKWEGNVWRSQREFSYPSDERERERISLIRGRIHSHLPDQFLEHILAAKR